MCDHMTAMSILISLTLLMRTSSCKGIITLRNHHLSRYTQMCAHCKGCQHIYGCLQVQQQLGAKHVISVCSSIDSLRATQALEQLLENADTIRGMVDLSGVHYPMLCTVMLLN